MRLAILGSTGFVGKILVTKALKAGHQVKALARSPEKLGDLTNQVEVIQGDMFEPATLQTLIKDVDAVISVAGPPLTGRHDSNKHGNAMHFVVEAMKAANVTRLITITGAAAKVPGQPLGLKQSLLRFVLSVLKPDVIKTKDIELKIISASGLNWTVIRPPLIGTGKPTGKVAALESDMAGTKIDVEDITDFILTLLQNHEWDRKAPVVASREC
jgi:putative NADH-flavin reductase